MAHAAEAGGKNQTPFVVARGHSHPSRPLDIGSRSRRGLKPMFREFIAAGAVIVGVVILAAGALYRFFHWCISL